MPSSRTPTWTSVLHWALTSAVLAALSCAAGVVALRIIGAVGLADDSRSAGAIVAAAMVAFIVGAWFVRRIDAAVVELVLGVDDQQIAAIAAIEHDLVADLGGERYVIELAATALALLRVPFVAVAIEPASGLGDALDHADPDGPTWSSGLIATAGTRRDAGVLVRPIRLGASDLGTITVGCRSRGRGFSSDDVAAVDALARQSALAISNARQAEALQASRERAVAGIEEERRRLRRNLHDELGPTLAAMKLRLGVLRRTGGLSADGAGHVDELSRMVDSTTADIRRLVDDLRPPLLDDLGLDHALRSLGFVPADLVLDVEASSDLHDLPAAVQVALYRIGSEAIRNVVRHAAATTCAVRLHRDDTAVTVTVVDDGRGIGDGHAEGVGLAAMRERADELGGLLTVSSGIDGLGCCVAATIPLQARSARTASHTPTGRLG